MQYLLKSTDSNSGPSTDREDLYLFLILFFAPFISEWLGYAAFFYLQQTVDNRAKLHVYLIILGVPPAPTTGKVHDCVIKLMSSCSVHHNNNKGKLLTQFLSPPPPPPPPVSPLYLSARLSRTNRTNKYSSLE